MTGPDAMTVWAVVTSPSLCALSTTTSVSTPAIRCVRTSTTFTAVTFSLSLSLSNSATVVFIPAWTSAGSTAC